MKDDGPKGYISFNEGGKVMQLEFLGKLQRILNEGLFVARYKYALILAIAELSAEKNDREDELRSD